MTVESEKDVEALQRVGKVVARVLQEMLDAIEPGMTTGALDELGARLLESHGARSAPQVAYDFPGATCISINEEVAHGIPGGRRIEPGDLVNVDVSAEMDGYFADTGGTRIVPPATPLKSRLCRSTRIALEQAMKAARAGAPINRIGLAIQKVAKKYRFRTIKNLGSHGVGRALHEDPTDILGYYEPRDQRLLEAGMVITIEPFLSTRTRFVEQSDDGWTLLAEAGNLSAQYEHTMIITGGEPLVVTTP